MSTVSLESIPSPFRPSQIRTILISVAVCAAGLARPLCGATTTDPLSHRFETSVRPLLKQYCLGCHSAQKHKGDLDLERFGSAQEVVRHPRVWQGVVEQIGLGEMPPKEKPQPTPAEREALLGWVASALDEAATARAGDPGPVVLRRLNNAEYNYTLRDLTGVPSLNPAKEFPADSAAGEGFMNTGNALVMSPALLTKYLDAGKDLANHAVLLPDGIAFSASTSQRDWTEERLAAIRSFYGRFSVNGGGSAVNLQGIKFDTKDGGVIPLARYLQAALEIRTRLAEPTADDFSASARRHQLSAKYLTTLWRALNATNESVLLDPLRSRWRTTDPAGVTGIVREIAQWQQALWRFTQIGHIGKRDGPSAWQMPVTPVAESREVRLKLPAPADQGAVTFYLATSDAGDGAAEDLSVWENPRLVAAGRTDLALRDLQAAVTVLRTRRQHVFESTTQCLAAASTALEIPERESLDALANRYNVASDVLASWLECLGIGSGAPRVEAQMTQKLESAQGYDFIKGWTGADALGVLANSSTQHVRIPGNMKPQSVAVHPSPKRRVLVGWRSPIAGTVRVSGTVQHAHPECGNGVTWSVELRRGRTRQTLASGTSQGGKELAFGPFENLTINRGDILSFAVGPRDGNHSCDLTTIDLSIVDGTNTWSLAADVSPDLLAGNPHADRHGNAAVWYFHSEPDQGGGSETVIPAGSILARWMSATDPAQKRSLASDLQKLLLSTNNLPASDSPDAALRRQLTAINGPLFRRLLKPENLAALREKGIAESKESTWGLRPGLFGPQPGATQTGLADLTVHAPSVLEVRVPAELAEGSEFVATARLHPQAGGNGSVQMHALASRPSAAPALAPGAVREAGSKSTWSDGDRPAASDSPILVRSNSPARRRIESALDEFRQLFPAALCYTKIVPVDEVVTLTLFYREDEHLRRLMLDDEAAAELERLWNELHYVSHDALKLVDAFEQLWQFATQDADPSAFEPMREPIKRRAETFRRQLADTQPAHLDAVLKFARGAYRRPPTAAEQSELRALYQRLRAEEIPHDQAVRLTLARVLVAPAFLYRAEKPGRGEKPGPVSSWELATRLSYFLWASAPDEALLAAAESGRLQDPAELTAQSRRMLRDPRVRRLATEFACTWLHIYAFDELGEKSDRHFPTFAGLRSSMYEETIRFFTDLFQKNGSLLDVVDADHSYLNASLAKHYGLPPLTGAASENWQRVDGLRKIGRGGILAQATTLAKQSGASRTSPILRGNWVAEVLLGEKLPRPPKDVPRLPEDEVTEQLTVRQLTEKHSTDPKCFGCHRRIDPYGYALEGFDAIGRSRERDLGGHPVETRTRLMDGTEIDGLEGLKRYIGIQRRDAFTKQFCRKLLGYALGRGVLLSDGPLISEMRSQLKANDYQLTAVFDTIVQSRQFREIRGADMPADD